MCEAKHKLPVLSTETPSFGFVATCASHRPYRDALTKFLLVNKLFDLMFNFTK